jgi:cytoskeletal protein CcmA (bactofilin family)
MQQSAHIGATIVIKGEVTAAEPLAVAGRIEGRIDAPGQRVTVSAGGQVHANVTAGTIVVAGAVKGDLKADERIELQAGAEVSGTVASPRMSVADGALVQGSVDIAGTDRTDLARAS